MRSIHKAGLVLACALLSANALACDTVVPPQQGSLFGPGKYCLNANRSASLELMGSDIELDCRGRTLTRPQNSGAAVGIRVNPGDRIVVRNCRIDGFPVGIDMSANAGSQLLNNTVLRAADAPIVVRGGPPSGDPQAEPMRIVGNRVVGYESGQPIGPGVALRVMGLPRAVIANNVVAGYTGSGGLELSESPDAQVTGNQFIDFSAAQQMIHLMHTPRVRVVHNTIVSAQPAMYGLVGADDATCVENAFVNVRSSGFERCPVARYNIDRAPAPGGF
ncbi:hypothetical protein J5226_16410 [Lysobacter sp. K5869]|uniref:right-handed parallel beta-helix repeat-containing protein n=1 Tax=Lysobacter sp. K5869 TaxID=2820808 RepID=UPI001C05F021|nr:right-handed parallel beta-helix repeat-containing protein [Lysobacter sp. K5869]QWP75202.1 hypothetical protein J5226_16410 [Lysobacter sp. K5869]